MKERALGLQGAKGVMGDKGTKGQPGEFGQEGGGGSFLGGLLIALAIGGTLIGAAKLLGPVILPMLTKGIFTKLVPILGKAFTGSFKFLGTGLTKLFAPLTKIPLGIGKIFGGISKGLSSSIGKIGTFAAGLFTTLMTGMGGSAKASESNMSFESSEGGTSDKELVEGDKDKTEVVEKRSYGNRILGGIDAMSGNLLDLDKKGGETFGGGRVFGGVLDAVTGNRFDFDRRGTLLDGMKNIVNPKEVKTKIPTTSKKKPNIISNCRLRTQDLLDTLQFKDTFLYNQQF